MDAFLAVACVVSGIFAGSTIGVVFGFSVAGHNDVLSGIEPKEANFLVRFLSRPTNNLSLVDSVLFVTIILSWILVFFGLCATPLFVAKLSDSISGTTLIVAYSAFAVAWFVGQIIGRGLWIRSVSPTSR